MKWSFKNVKVLIILLVSSNVCHKCSMGKTTVGILRAPQLISRGDNLQTFLCAGSTRLRFLIQPIAWYIYHHKMCLPWASVKLFYGSSTVSIQSSSISYKRVGGRTQLLTLSFLMAFVMCQRAENKATTQRKWQLYMFLLLWNPLWISCFISCSPERCRGCIEENKESSPSLAGSME